MFGHQKGVKAVRETVEACAEAGVSFLTLYAFSTENWQRPAQEVSALMELLVYTIGAELETLLENNIRLETIGDIRSLPGRCYEELQQAKERTAKHSGLTLILALNYSSRWDVTNAVKKLSSLCKAGELEPEEVTEQMVAKQLTTAPFPDPELLIRTSGEFRISNFLLWELAYTELLFCPKLWPDFTKQDLFQAILDFQKRERRFGKTSEQIKQNS